MLAKGHILVMKKSELVQIHCDSQDKNTMADHSCDWLAITQKWSENGRWPAVISHPAPYVYVYMYMQVCDFNLAVAKVDRQTAKLLAIR